MLTQTVSRRGRPSPVVLFSAVMFLVFDATVLGLGYWIAHQVESDAVAINLAGRQRMLSQRMVKALLLMRRSSERGQDASGPRDELLESISLFDSTLNAFARGAVAVGGDGTPVFQAAILDHVGAGLVAESLALWQPYEKALRTVTVDSRRDHLESAADMAQATNLQLLSLANRLTSHIEHQSRAGTERLRLLQVLAFVLALINFCVLLRSMWRQVRGLSAHSSVLQRQARIDALTGLPNRTELLERLGQALSRLNTGETGLVVGFLDLDRFKPVNDQYGHVVGDRVLRQAAERLRERLRQSDLIARIGGDEFVVLLEGVTSQAPVAAILDGLAGALRAPFRVGDIEVCIGLSIGALLVTDGKLDAPQVLARADEEMYRVKRDADRDWHLSVLSAASHSQSPHGSADRSQQGLV